jgi:hypothetical protein
VKYRFSCGNSSTGVVGFCVEVRASSPAEALERLQEALPASAEVDPDDDEHLDGPIRVYFNDAALALSDVEEIEEDSDGEASA